MITLSAVDLVLRCADATDGASEVPANTNHGPYVKIALALCGLEEGNPWCAAQVAKVGVAALQGLWPVPRTGGCQALYEFGVKRNVIDAAPARGAIFLVWHAESKRFAHTGLIRAVHGSICDTHEGNTSGGGSREGWLVANRQRHFAPEDRFLHWYNLLQ